MATLSRGLERGVRQRKVGQRPTPPLRRTRGRTLIRVSAAGRLEAPRRGRGGFLAGLAGSPLQPLDPARARAETAEESLLSLPRGLRLPARSLGSLLSVDTSRLRIRAHGTAVCGGGDPGQAGSAAIKGPAGPAESAQPGRALLPSRFLLPVRAEGDPALHAEDVGVLDVGGLCRGIAGSLDRPPTLSS